MTIKSTFEIINEIEMKRTNAPHLQPAISNLLSLNQFIEKKIFIILNYEFINEIFHMKAIMMKRIQFIEINLITELKLIY